MWTRRQWLALPFALRAKPGRADSGSRLLVTEVAIERAGRFASKCLVLRPARVPEAEPLPISILLHGLGETTSVELGIRAWSERYGLPQAYARLCSPPVTRTLPEPYLSEERSAEINRELQQAPFPDLMWVCPFTPNVWKQQPTGDFLERYADHLERALLPAVRAATATLPGSEHLGLGGVSLGGYVALEVFIRRPQLFGVLGCVQGAFSSALAEVFARRLSELIAPATPPAIALISSTRDPYRRATERLSERLRSRGVPATLRIPAGPHDQRFLREVGTPELLLHQARALRPAS